MFQFSPPQLATESNWKHGGTESGSPPNPVTPRASKYAHTHTHTQPWQVPEAWNSSRHMEVLLVSEAKGWLSDVVQGHKVVHQDKHTLEYSPGWIILGSRPVEGWKYFELSFIVNLCRTCLAKFKHVFPWTIVPCDGVNNSETMGTTTQIVLFYVIVKQEDDFFRRCCLIGWGGANKNGSSSS